MMPEQYKHRIWPVIGEFAILTPKGSVAAVLVDRGDAGGENYGSTRIPHES